MNILLIIIILVLCLGIGIYFLYKNIGPHSDNQYIDCSKKDGTSTNVLTYGSDPTSGNCIASKCMSGYGIDIDGNPDHDWNCPPFNPWTFTPNTMIIPDASSSFIKIDTTLHSMYECSKLCETEPTCVMANYNNSMTTPLCQLMKIDPNAKSESTGVRDIHSITKGLPPPGS